MHLSVGTSLAIIIPTSLRSFHRPTMRRGAVDMELLKSLHHSRCLIGVVLASLAAAYHLERAACVSVFAAHRDGWSALRLLFNRESMAARNGYSGQPGPRHHRRADRLFLDADGRRRRGDEQHLHDALSAVRSTRPWRRRRVSAC
jgi:hypothetical protein